MSQKLTKVIPNDDDPYDGPPPPDGFGPISVQKSAATTESSPDYVPSS